LGRDLHDWTSAIASAVDCSEVFPVPLGVTETDDWKKTRFASGLFG
jgi:hypothetical protein